MNKQLSASPRYQYNTLFRYFCPKFVPRFSPHRIEVELKSVMFPRAQAAPSLSFPHHAKKAALVLRAAFVEKTIDSSFAYAILNP